MKLEEVPCWNKQQGLCCGAGGAQYFMEEETNHEKVNTKCALQLYDTGADTIASTCPFGIDDHHRSHGRRKDESVRRLDIAEVHAESIEFRSDADAAE